MREIEFRAKTKNSGRWAYGDLVTQRYNSRQGIHIYEKNDKMQSGYQFVRIDKRTIGQYTGFCDKNGKKIFEGDIVIAHYFFQNYDPTTLGTFEDEDEITGKIIFDLDGFRVVDRKDDCRQLPLSMIQEPVEELEIIGNIFDNPELLKEKQDE